MEDCAIVTLYLQRNEDAIGETEKKYGKYLFAVADNILSSTEDSGECVNDTYLRAWNSIPPHEPSVLRTYLAKITRHLSIDIYRSRKREKRADGEYAASLEELEEVVGGGSVSDELDYSELCREIERFLSTQSDEKRAVFVMRYFYFTGIKQIAKRLSFSEAKVKTALFRLRAELRDYLNERGYSI